MKLGIISTDDATFDLARQLLTAHACHRYAQAQALAHLREDAIQLAVLDLEGMDDAAVDAALVALAALKQGTTEAGQAAIPVLLLATPAQRALLQVLRAAGADDYLVKPIRRHELALRLDVLLAPLETGFDAGRQVEAAEFVFDLATFHATNRHRPELDIALTQKETEVALLLLEHLGRPLSRAFIQERIWGKEPEVPTRTIDTHVSRVRNKLGLKPEFGYKLGTVYGYGYQLERV